MALAPFAIDPDLTGIAIAYKNDQYIADLVAPRQKVMAELFEVDFLETDTLYLLQEDRVGRMSAPNQVVWKSSRTQFATEDHALDSPVPQKDTENYQGVGPSPMAMATELVAEYLALNREKRVSDLVQAPASYAAGNQVTLSGTSQWSDYANSNPVDAILSALDVPLVRPTHLVISNYTWRILRQHPRVVESVKATGAGSAAQGVVSREAVAELLELDGIWVGQARGKAMPQNIAAAASTPPRLWGKHAALITADPLARLTLTNRPTFLLTAQHGDRVAGIIQDPDMGMRGGVRVRAGEEVREVIISQECAYLFENAVA